MPLARCDDCGREISTRAKACPNCGSPNESGIPTPKDPMAVVDLRRDAKAAAESAVRPTSSPRGTADHPMVIERTGRRLKAHMLVSGLAAVVNWIAYWTAVLGNHQVAATITGSIATFALVYFVLVRILAWWRHG